MKAERKKLPEPWAYLVPVFLLLILASPMPPFFAVPQTASYIWLSQLAAGCILVIGFAAGWLLKRPLLQFISFLGVMLCAWQLPYADFGNVEARICSLLSAQGAVAQASITDSNWRQPQAIFFLFRGGGGHPTHIFDLDLRYSGTDGIDHVVHESEAYPPGWSARFNELQNTFRRGNVIAIRYLPKDSSLVRTQQYLDSFERAAVANPIFITVAPWIFAFPVLMALVKSIFGVGGQRA